MRLFSNLFFALCFLLVSWSSQAEMKLVAEPYLGWMHGYYNSQAGKNAGKKNTSLYGMDLGARLLIKHSQFFFGPDFSYIPSGKIKLDGVGSFRAVNTQKLGLLAGMDFFQIVRFWLGYNFLERVGYSYTASGITYDNVLNGHSFKLGVGYTTMYFLSLNFEYIRSTYRSFDNKTTQNGKTVSSSGTYSGKNVYNGDVFLVSLSAPIEFYSFW